MNFVSEIKMCSTQANAVLWYMILVCIIRRTEPIISMSFSFIFMSSSSLKLATEIGGNKRQNNPIWTKYYSMLVVFASASPTAFKCRYIRTNFNESLTLTMLSERYWELVTIYNKCFDFLVLFVCFLLLLESNHNEKKNFSHFSFSMWHKIEINFISLNIAPHIFECLSQIGLANLIDC